MNVKVLGIDLGKTVFHLIGMDEHGKIVLKKRYSRSQLFKFLANTPVCLIGMEAAAVAITWAGLFPASDMMSD